MRIKIFEKNIIVLRLLSRRWQAPGAVKKRRKKPNREKTERSCQCLYMFLTTQSKKPNLRRRSTKLYAIFIVASFVIY